MRTDLLTTFKKAINNIKDIEKYLDKCSEKSFVKYSMLKDSLKEIKSLRVKALEDHEACENNPGLYIIKGVEYQFEVRHFYETKVKYYRWLLDL
jgi:hypothetical protein